MANPLKDSGLSKKFDWPLNGKLRKDVDGILVGETNFQSLVNLRYSADCPKGILGMTPINVVSLGGSISNGFLFRRDSPVESHIFAQVSAELYKSDNTTLIPNQDTFSAFETLEDSTLVRFSKAPDGAMCALNGTTNRIWSGNEDRVSGFFLFDPANDFFWYDFTDQINNTLTDAQDIATLYHAVDGKIYFYIATKRPIQGVKFYVGTKNTNATSTLIAYEWNGSAWVALTSVDSTMVGGAAFAQTGEVTFPSTVLTSKLRAIDNAVAFFYKFVITGVDATTTITHCTIDAPMQPLNDIWNGIIRPCVNAAQWINAKDGYVDLTTNLALSTTSLPKAYYESDPTTYAELGGMTSSDHLYLGFAEPMMGLSVSLPDSSKYANSVVSSLTVEYFNGTTWASVGNLVDLTVYGGNITFNHTGLITWNPVTPNTEFKTRINGQDFWYYYRLTFSTTIYSDVRVDAIGGITAPLILRPYKFSTYWQNRLFLFNDQSDRKNTGICSNYGTNVTFNGDDSPTLEFGDGGEVMCAESLFSRFGQGIYDDLVVLKKDATYLVDGTYSSNWITFEISNEVGCVAPPTLARCDVSFDIATGITKHVLMWRSARGVEYFDGNTLTLVIEDINTFFNPGSSDYIDPQTYDVSLESGFFDNMNLEYHWIFTNGLGKQEWAFSVRYKKWYQIFRSSKALTTAFQVTDGSGNFFAYGCTADGFIERLENGTTMDGVPMVYTFKLGDILLAKAAEYVTELRHIKLSARTKNIDTEEVICYHFADTAISGTAFSTFSQADATKRVYQWKQSLGIKAVYHCLQFTVITTEELIGFEPLLVSGLYSIVREDL